jgi:glycosyltransferase involved in cell wall biosynthesis
MKVSILIAVYNEAETVARLLERVRTVSLPQVTKELIIIESNSTDGSRAVVEDFVARHAGESSLHVQAVYQDGPRGKGHAIRAGLAVASGEIVLIQDADLEYDVADYPDLLRPIIEGRAAFVLGSRHMGRDRWKIRKFARADARATLMNAGGMLFHGLFNLLFGTHLTDPTTMYKVFRADCLNGLIFTCDRFDFDFELTGKLIRAGFMPLEVPVSYNSRGFDAGKKIRIVRDPITWIAAILACRFACMPSAASRATAKSRPPVHRHGTS